MKPTSVPFTHRGRPHVLFLRKRDAANPGAPYYFRVDGRPLSTKQCTVEAGLREARARLELRASAPGDYAAALENLKARASRTVGQLVTAWAAAGHPHPNGQPRTLEQRDRQDVVLKLALPWWSDKAAVTIAGPTLNAYAQWRRGHARAGAAATRSIDMELTALAACFAWAVATGQVQLNPFLKRPRFHGASAVSHCSSHMPASADELHAIARLLLGSASPVQVVAGAQLLFSALTGLRPGEPGFLRWDATWSAGRPQPGLRYTTGTPSAPLASAKPFGAAGSGERAGVREFVPTELLAVQREKNGINPAVHVHPALAAFLDAWSAYSRPRWNSAWMFPHPADPTRPYMPADDKNKRLSQPLEAALQALGLPHRKPHAFRAFYVRVRRSQGVDDARIAVELGQGSGPGLVVRTYGETHGIHGDGRFDWLPAPPAEPAWAVLHAAVTSPVIPFAPTLDTPQETPGDCPTLSNILPALSGQNQKKPLTLNEKSA